MVDRQKRERSADDHRHELAEDATLPEYFWAVARQLRGMSARTLAPWAITPSHSRALVVLMRHGPMRLSDLAEHLRIAPRSATEVVDALQAQQFVERQPDPIDRRATLVVLTDEGEQAGREMRAARAADTESYFATLSATDRAQLTRILRKLLN